MVKGGLFRGQIAPAVLTFEPVTGEHICAAEWGRFTPDLNEFEETDDRRRFDDERDRADEMVVFLNDLDLAAKEHRHGALPRDDSKRFVAGVK